jgi:hypothetical protein
VRKDIEQLRNRLVTVTQSKFEKLDKADARVLGEPQLTIEVQVSCEAWGEGSDVSTLLSEDGCDFQ